MANTAARPGSARNRAALLGLIALVIAVGLASRKFPFLFPAFLGKYPGDSLWALMVFFGWSFIKPSASTLKLSLFGLGTSYLVEFSQLYHAGWINALRATTIGHLALGSGFSWRDMAAYTVGIGIGTVLDRLFFNRARIAASR